MRALRQYILRVHDAERICACAAAVCVRISGVSSCSIPRDHGGRRCWDDGTPCALVRGCVRNDCVSTGAELQR
eukprot:6214467-Pleurochrysis_carterae.AAC.6